MGKLLGGIVLMRWRWLLGIVATLFMILIAVTGILLNHSHELGLDRTPLESPLLRPLYKAAEPAGEGLVHALPAGELRAAGGRLRLGGSDLGACPRLVGVVEQPGQILAVCNNRLWLLTRDGRVIDQADGGRGVPEGLSAVASREGQVLLRHERGSVAVDLNDLTLMPVVPEAGVAWSEAPVAVPASDIDWGRALRDLHSGRVFGSWGVWLMDGMAVLFVLLAVSGLLMACRHHRST